LTPGKNGAWTRKILHNFNQDGVDGEAPTGGLIFDKDGNLYGTTRFGGAYGYGTVCELTPSNGKWTEKVVHAFKARMGPIPGPAWSGTRPGIYTGRLQRAALTWMALYSK
jgi:uncharacterized repeat protein (TIGR03803 family)